MTDSAASSSPAPIEFGDALSRFGRWCRTQPVSAFLLFACLGLLIYFFGFFKIFVLGTQTTAHWAAKSWNPENNQEHSWFILPISIFLIWYHRDKIQAAPKVPSNLGLAFVLGGVLTFLTAVRALQPRIAILAFPILIYGMVRYLWGRDVAKVFIFPCLFMLFMEPMGGLVQGTVSLQLLVSSGVKMLSTFIGVQVQTIGTELKATDGSFNFNIAEGCSGIRSLMAMTTLAALYVHFTQRELWKQLLIFGMSIIFALIGNVARVFSVVLVAKLFGEKFAGDLYHDYSGFVFFPVGVGAMVLFSQLLNRNWGTFFNDAMKPEAPTPGKKSSGPVSYDY